MARKWIDNLSVAITKINVSDNREDLVEVYFSCGYPYRSIVCFLYFVHGITVSLRQLKQILRRLNLRRRHTIDRSLIAQAISLIRVNE